MLMRIVSPVKAQGYGISRLEHSTLATVRELRAVVFEGLLYQLLLNS